MKRLICLLILSGCTMKKAPDPVQLSLAELIAAPAACVPVGQSLISVDCPKGKQLTAEDLQPLAVIEIQGCKVAYNSTAILNEDQVCRVLAGQIANKQAAAYQILQGAK